MRDRRKLEEWQIPHPEHIRPRGRPWSRNGQNEDRPPSRPCVAMARAGRQRQGVALDEPCAKESVMQRRVGAVIRELRLTNPRKVIPLECRAVGVVLSRLAGRQEAATDQCAYPCGVDIR